MKLRVALLVALMLGLCSSQALAQVSAGLKGGIGLGTLAFEDDAAADDISDSRTGFIIGAYGEWRSIGPTSIVLEGLYNQKGAKGINDFTAELDYVQIPILLKIPLGGTSALTPFIYGGGAPAFKVSAKQSVGDIEEDLEDVRAYDMSVIVGGGLRFGNISVEARYDHGLMSTNEESDAPSVKTRQIAFLVSLLLYQP